MSKTFVSVALDIAEAEGRLALDDPALGYYPELKGAAAPGLDQVTLRHLLTMTSGSPHPTPAPGRTWRPARCAPRPAPASATT